MGRKKKDLRRGMDFSCGQRALLQQRAFRNWLKFELEIAQELEMELLPAAFFLISLAACLICSLTMLSSAH
jgi:hypothetical protein